MKTIELSVIGREDDRSVCYYRNDEVVGWLSDNCGITDSDIILIGKKDFEELLANQKKPERKDLPSRTKVMVDDASGNPLDLYGWRLAVYAGNSHIVSCRFDGDVLCAHIIPYSLFDPDNPDKWNGTENDYGTEGGAR